MTILASAAAGKKKHLPLGLLVLGGGLPLALLALMIVVVVVAAAPANAQVGVQGKDCAPLGSSSLTVAGFGPDQMANAATIVAVGSQLALPEQGWVVAIAAAMQESSLVNLSGGDLDSAGLFQERPSQGWGTHAQVTDPTYAATQFYKHLQAVPNWQQLSVNDAAQAVERSGLPDAYGRHEQAAREVVGALQGTTCQPGSGGGAPPTNPQAQTVINAALAELGVPYVWGGGTARGPSGLGGSTSGLQGFDCSGLALFAYAKIGIAVPHQTQQIWAAFQPAIRSPSDVQPGDLILLSSNGSGPGADIHHVAIYLGNGRVVEAPHAGATVQITSNIWTNSYWTSQFIGAVRPGVH
jgi:cell wall-associated NlpC family hydrolase